MILYSCFGPEDRTHQVLGKDRSRGAVGHHLPAVKHHESVGVLGCQIEVVQHGDDPNPFPRPCSGTTQRAVLVRQIQIVRRLVEKQISMSGWWRLPDLRRRSGERNPLLLATGEHRVRPLSKGSHLHVRKRRLGNGEVLRLLPPDHVRRTPHEHHVERGKSRLQMLLLGNQSATLRE